MPAFFDPGHAKNRAGKSIKITFGAKLLPVDTRVRV
jgi:hypothetical protein